MTAFNSPVRLLASCCPLCADAPLLAGETICGACRSEALRLSRQGPSLRGVCA